MKKIIIVLLFALAGNMSFAQSWIKKAEFTDSALASNGGTGGATTFTLGDTGYVVGGANGFNFLQNTFIYDTVTNTWSTVANFPYTESGYGGGVKAGFAINDKGYVGTGSFFGQPLAREFYEYDPATNTWFKRAYMSEGRGYGVGFSISGRGFIGSGVGGVNVGTFGPPLYDFWEYNPNEGDSGTWTQIANYPGEGNQLCFAFTVGDKAYVGGGAITNSSNQTTGYADDFWEYDTINKFWTKVKTFPGGPRFQGSSLSTCNRGYIGLGQNASGTLVNDFWEFDPNKGDSGTWTQIASIPISSGRGSPESFTVGKSIFTGMGGGTNGNVPDWWEYIPQYTPAFSADTSVCAGGSITFTDTSNYEPSSWYWQFPGGTPGTDTTSNPTITYNSPGNYDVILTAWSSCDDTGTKTFANYVTVGNGGILSVTQSPAKVCSGQSVTLVVNDTGTFTWSPSVGLSKTTGDTVMVNDTATTIYLVTGTSSGGCTPTGIDTVKIIAAPPLTVLPLSPSTCVGQPVTLSVDTSGSDYVWMPALTLSSSTGDSVNAAPTAQTTYTVTGVDSLGCPVTGHDTVSVRVGFNKPIITDTNNVLTTTATEGNQWYRNGSEINGATGEKYTATDTGCYWDIATNIANGCSSISDTVCVTPSGIQQLSINPNQLSVYPNPTDGEIFININSSVTDVKDWNLQITDVLGRIVYSKLSLNYNNDIDLSDLPGGVYFIVVIDKSKRAVFPIVRQND